MATVDKTSSCNASYPEPVASFGSFLRLPRDIRLIIYSYIVSGLVLTINEPLIKAPGTAILGCSRLIRQEATPITYQLAHFRISRQEFCDLLAPLSTTLRPSRPQDLAHIRNLVLTSFEVNRILYDPSNFPPTALVRLRNVLIELEVCSCGPAHFCIRRRSCEQVAYGQGFEASPVLYNNNQSYIVNTVLRNLDKLREQVQWMRNAKRYEVAIKMVMMDNKGKVGDSQTGFPWKSGTPDEKWNCDQVSILMITRKGVEFVEGDDAIAEKGKKLLIDSLGIYDEKANI